MIYNIYYANYRNGSRACIKTTHNVSIHRPQPPLKRLIQTLFCSQTTADPAQWFYMKIIIMESLGL